MKQQVLEETFVKILKKELDLLHVEIDEESPYLFLYPYFLARKRTMVMLWGQVKICGDCMYTFLCVIIN